MTFAYVGSLTDDFEAAGISMFEFDEDSGELALRQFAPQPSPSHLAIASSRSTLYAASHVAFTDGAPGGSIVAYRLDQTSGKMTAINSQIIPLTHPAYVEIDRSDQFLFAACTGGGGVVVLPIEEDGGLGAPSTVQMHPGLPLIPLGESSRVGPKPAGACQPHSVGADPTNRIVIAPDLLLETIVLSVFDSSCGGLDRVDSDLKFPDGTGPRHFKFHPTNGLLYVFNETASSISVLSCDARSSSLSLITAVSTLPASYAGKNKGADIILSEDGRFLYCTNRGHDSIAMCEVDESTGQLSLIGWVPTGGKAPRGLSPSREGGFVVVANRDSNNVATFHCDAKTGLLKATGSTTEVRRPSDIVFC